MIYNFPNEKQLLSMKKMMDGESKGISKTDLKDGMKSIGVSNILELIIWGLKSGIIRDKPITLTDIKSTGFEYYPKWLQVLNLTIAGYSDREIEDASKLSSDSIKYYRKLVADKFNIGNSLAKYIRLGFQLLEPISPPATSPIFHSTLEYPPVLSKFRPSNIDPNIPVYDASSKFDIKSKNNIKLPRHNYTKSEKEKFKQNPTVRSTSIQTALFLLGIDDRILKNKTGDRSVKKPFWKRSPEYLWNLLELAKRRYELEISHAHPDVGGNSKRASQINSAWNLVKKLFAKHGYKLNK